MRTRIVIAAVFVFVFALAPLARADGLPVTGTQLGGPPTLQGPNTNGRIVALQTKGGTVVARFGQVVYTSRFLPGRFAIPQVAQDGSAAGLSWGGTALVLISPRRTFPRRTTTLAVLDPVTLKTRSRIVLQGDYSFDAVSPSGTRMYLIHYLSSRNPNRYEVRAWDLLNARMLPDPVVDPTEVDEQMRGYPITRVTSADGRFAYTLYDGAGKTPFVHALDTSKGAARCIDLDMLAGNQNLYRLRLVLSADGTKLAVMDGNRQLTAVDTRTYLPVAEVVAPKERSRSWPTIAAAAILALLATGGALYGLRRLLRDRNARGVPRNPEGRSSRPVAERDGV
jgi:hypothetical protein